MVSRIRVRVLPIRIFRGPLFRGPLIISLYDMFSLIKQNVSTYRLNMDMTYKLITREPLTGGP